MRHKLLCILAAVLVSGAANADSFRYRAQPERARVWVIDGNGLFLEERGSARRAVRLPEWQFAAEPYACAPDIAIGPRGEAVVTSNVEPVLWRIDAQTLAVSVHRLQLDADMDKDVGFSSLLYSERNRAYFAVSQLTGSLWRIDPLLRRAQKIALSEPVYGACAMSVPRAGGDTLCLHGDNGSRLLTFAPDQRSAHVRATGCSATDGQALGESPRSGRIMSAR
jgi:hypothetical protein